MATARRSSSSYGGFADGIIIRGVPLLTLYPGNVYWVDSNGGGGSRGTFTNPVATIAEAEALLTTDNGDIIVVKPGHAETITSTVDFDLSGFAIIGLGFGDNRPTITMSATSADDGWDFAGDDIVIYNMRFVDGGGGATGALPCINCSGDYITIDSCHFELGSDMSTCVTFDTTGKEGFAFLNNTVVGIEAGPDVGIRFEVSHRLARIENNTWVFQHSAGIDSGCVVFVSGTADADTGGHIIANETALGMADGNVYLWQAAVQPHSLMRDCHIEGADASDHLGLTPGNGFGFMRCAVVEEATGGPTRYSGGGGLYRPLVASPTP